MSGSGSNSDSGATVDLQGWVGRTETASDTLGVATLERLWATLDRKDAPPQNGEVLPPLAHWLYCLHAAPRALLGRDGHEQRGHFIPPIVLPRRMWASSRIRFLAGLRVGQSVKRVSTIRSVTPKSGRSGALVFVTLEHELSGDAGPAIMEIQDVVYREPGSAMGEPERAHRAAQWSRTIAPDSVLLFRYSALTFNGHRIHFDRPYATATEGYPGLIVHGPLIATMLVDLARDNMPGEPVTGLDIRARAPLFDTAPFALNGRRCEGGAELWACDMTGGLAMDVRLYTTPSPDRADPLPTR